MLPGMIGKPRIAVIGAGNLGAALALSLRKAGYTIDAVIARSGGASLSKAQQLAKEIGARAITGSALKLRADVIWFCVPDGEIQRAAESFANRVEWKKVEWEKKVALHSSGALTSGKLAPLRQRGASVASVHPMMTFVRGSRPSLARVPFAIEGNAAAVRVARRIVSDLGADAYSIRKRDKVAYHAWGAFASPLLLALLVTTEQVAAIAGVKRKAARRRMIPILLQTLANYATRDAADAFSGPIIRGDVDTVKQHLRVLRKAPVAHDVYRALVTAALHYLPSRKRASLANALRKSRR
jgi:predicted short-subunit dehydrogenase-like oxidoreductase (DUF2520 family)